MSESEARKRSTPTTLEAVGRMANVRVPSWVWGVLCSIAIGLASWAHGRLWDTEGRLIRLESRDEEKRRSEDEIKGMLKELAKDIRELRDRLPTKP